MLIYDKECGKQEAAIFKALGHPTRLWIVEQLADGREHCVCEFVEAVGVDFSTISQHLAVLKKAGIIADDKRGKQVFYSLCFSCLIDFIHCLRQPRC